MGPASLAARASPASWTRVWLHACDFDLTSREKLMILIYRSTSPLAELILDHSSAGSFHAWVGGRDDEGAAEQPRGVPIWLRLPHSHASILRTAQLREAGWSQAAALGRTLLPPPRFARELRYQRTVRGHHFAVYCIAFDRTGRRIITGSDDRLVKVTCLTGCELASVIISPICTEDSYIRTHTSPRFDIIELWVALFCVGGKR